MPLWTLRPYQREAVQTLTALAPAKQFLLLQAATGAGKTLMAAALMRHFTDRWRFRCLFLAHKAILVRQALERMQTSFDDADINVDCLCASVSKPGHSEGHIIVASPQTLARRLDDLPRVDLIVIDECHRVPPKSQPSLYASVIQAVTAKRPNARVAGITATPWRLGQGAIYGPSSRPGTETWWDTLDVRISIQDLQEQGWLAPLAARVTQTPPELAALPVGASGDFREDMLEETLLRPLHLGSAVKAVQEQAGECRRIAAFCVTIAHARALAARFRECGISACAIDSKSGEDSNRAALNGFERGSIRVLCSVGMLSEGWDCPQTDGLLMCRPTLSPALYVQMVGRGLRQAPGKKRCLLLDLSGNVLRHGSPNNPRLEPASGVEMLRGPGSHGISVEAERRCPLCEALLPAESVLNCPCCGAELYALTENGQSFRDIDLARLEQMTRRREELRRQREQARAEEKAHEAELKEERARRRAGLLNHGEPVLVRLLEHTKPETHRIAGGPAAGAVILKVELLVEVPDGGRRSIRLFLDPEGAMGRRSRTCFWALNNTKSFWKRCGQGFFPSSKAGMLSRWESVVFPEHLLVRQSSGGWIRVLWDDPAAGKDRKAAQSIKSTTSQGGSPEKGSSASENSPA